MAQRSNTVQDSFQNVVPPALQNTFVEGLKTEFTGLNFPANACTDTENCVFTMIGDVLRREGFDYEANFVLNTINRTDKAISTYRWLNVGGDGLTQVYVLQIGGTLFFFRSSTATVLSPLSTQLLAYQITLSSFLAEGSALVPDEVECQFSDGNGYLFVYHPYCDPFYCNYNNGAIIGSVISINIRDFVGYPEPGTPTNLRPTTLSSEHNYNLQNQGWTNAATWVAACTANPLSSQYNPAAGYIPTGTQTFTVPAGISGIVTGEPAVINYSCSFVEYDTQGGSMESTGNSGTAAGTVVSYSGTSLVILVSSTNYSSVASAEFQFFTSFSVTISSSNVINTINTWNSEVGNYPSNSDVWWTFKDSTGVFNPASTLSNLGHPSSPAPSGHFILNAFNQQQSNVSGITGLTSFVTSVRPKTGAWYSGRVWYTGIDAAQTAMGDQNYYTWTESIYFSQIITDVSQFGLCYQQNDPSDENLFDLLPSDGGVINIQGCGSIYKLFPIQNGLLVFAANGIWFITGSQGIGFAANDYTITKISAVESISSTSFVDVQGMPIFWNQEGIYTVSPTQQGLGLTVSPVTLGTIRTFYNSIPLDSKKYARGSYNPITYVLQWVYRTVQESDLTSRYQFDGILNLNTNTKAFYPYKLNSTDPTPYIHGVNYIASPGGSAAPDPTFKYVCSTGSSFTFAEERDDNYVDWASYNTAGFNYSSYFVTGYSIDGQAQRQFQLGYLYMYSRNTEPTAYKIQGIWDFATSGNSGKYSSVQVANINKPYFGMVHRRHRIRGHGLALQMKISSVDNTPFDIMGWSVWSTQNSAP